jgi:hypothetical protein
MSIKRKAFKKSVAIILTLVMILTFVPMVALAAEPLATPVVTRNGGQPRTISWLRVDNADHYRVWAFDTEAKARAGDTADATAFAIIEQPSSGNIPTQDFRRMIFTDNVGDGSGVRSLQSGWTPAGLGTSNAPNWDTYGKYTNNLVPGVYWLRVQAMPGASSTDLPSALSTMPAGSETAHGFVVAMGPDEAKKLIEDRFDKLNETLVIICVRARGAATPAPAWRNPSAEAGDEGILRFTSVFTGGGTAVEDVDAFLGINLLDVGERAAARALVTVLNY